MAKATTRVLTVSEQETILNFLRTEYRNHNNNVTFYSGIEGKEKTIAWNKARLNDIMLIQSIIRALPTIDDTPSSAEDCPF